MHARMAPLGSQSYTEGGLNCGSGESLGSIAAFTGSETKATGIWRLTSYVALALPVLVFLSLYGWRPFGLGFYSDDWYVMLHPNPGSTAAFFDVLELYNNRPASAVFAWLAQAFAGWSTAYAQALNALLMAMAAASVGLLTYSLGELIASGRGGTCLGAGFAAAFFLAFPWSLGFSAWTTAATAIAPATIFFCLGAYFLVGERGRRMPSQIISCLFMAASFLSYESFYGQFAFILVLAAALQPKKPLDWIMLRPAVLLVLVNIGCFAHNRLAGGNRKEFTSNWLAEFIEGYFTQVIPNVAVSFQEIRPMIFLGAVLSGFIGIYFIARRIGSGRAALVILAVLAGIYAAGILYAMVGYRLITIGIFARVTIVLSVYASVFLGLLCTASISHCQDWLARWQIVGSIALLTGFGIASAYRVLDWTRSWEIQRDALRQFPLVSSEADAFRGGFLYLGPLGPPSVPTATAPWEISGAVAYALAAQSTQMASRAMAALWAGNQPWFTDLPNWSTDWDGKSFSQRVCANPATEYAKAVDTVKIWRVGEDELKPAPTGFHSGCEIPVASK